MFVLLFGLVHSFESRTFSFFWRFPRRTFCLLRSSNRDSCVLNLVVSKFVMRVSLSCISKGFEKVIASFSAVNSVSAGSAWRSRLFHDSPSLYPLVPGSVFYAVFLHAGLPSPSKYSRGFWLCFACLPACTFSIYPLNRGLRVTSELHALR